LDRVIVVVWKAVNLAEVTNDEWQLVNAPSVSTVAGMRPTGWSAPSTCLGRTAPPP
jgi:hypothetical protein